MTREEALKAIEYAKERAEVIREQGQSEYWAQEINWTIEALDMAIEALQKPPISQRRMCQAGYRQGREETLKQDTGKLNNSDDSLLTTDSEVCKEQKSKLDRKTEPMKTTDYCDICKRDMCEFCVADNANPYCVPSHYEIKQDEPQKGDLISRAEAIEAIENTDWYHQNQNKDMVHGANSDEHQAWYKAQDIYEALEAVPSADRQMVIKCKPFLSEEDFKAFAKQVSDQNVILISNEADVVSTNTSTNTSTKSTNISTDTSADRPRGEWHYSNGKPATIGQSFGVICDQCGTESEYCTNFCGECGADMRGDNK